MKHSFQRTGVLWAQVGFLLAALAAQPVATANGIYRNGAGARAMSLGGASVGLPDTPLEALHANPAGLGLLNAPVLQLGAAAGVPHGEFANGANPGGSSMGDSHGVLPEAALALPLTAQRLSLGLAFVPDAAMGAEWSYVDAPGGLGGATSYGLQKHRSEIIVLRTALGAALSVSDSLALGASLGVIYNRNRLEAPYIFQNHPVLQGFKTLLDLRTEGWGVNGNFGIVCRPNETVSIGFGYQTRTTIRTSGDATGNAGVQLRDLGGGFAAVRPDFHYDAEVDTVFPQSASAGLSVRWHSRLRSVFQIEWIDWSNAFDNLPIRLTNGDNPDLNTFLGTSGIDDTIPLNWRDRIVYRTGLEWEMNERLTVRGGYSYGKNPVPAATLTPLTAAIMEHTLTAGLGWRHGRYFADAAYQYDLPQERAVGASGLRASEYSGSRTRVGVHWFGVTTGIRF